MASAAAFVMTLASDEPKATVVSHEGADRESPGVAFFGSDRDDASEGAAGGGWGTAMKRGVGSGRGAKTSRNRRGGAAVAGRGEPSTASKHPQSGHTSNRPHRSRIDDFSKDPEHPGVRVE